MQCLLDCFRQVPRSEIAIEYAGAGRNATGSLPAPCKSLQATIKVATISRPSHLQRPSSRCRDWLSHRAAAQQAARPTDACRQLHKAQLQDSTLTDTCTAQIWPMQWTSTLGEVLAHGWRADSKAPGRQTHCALKVGVHLLDDMHPQAAAPLHAALLQEQHQPARAPRRWLAFSKPLSAVDLAGCSASIGMHHNGDHS